MGVECTKGADISYEHMWEGVIYLNVMGVECTRGEDKKCRKM